jgi:TatD DNase family protein
LKNNFSEKLFDTHAHLDFDAFDDDREEVIERARSNGVEYIVTIGSGDGLSCADAAIEIAESHENIWASVGVHPHDAKLVKNGGLDKIRELCKKEKVVAIGETGLDYVKNHSPKDVQIKCFREQLAISREMSLPVIIHDRDAHGDLMGILKSDGVGEAVGIMHCYSGSAEMARQLVEMGFFISFPGVITFKNAKQLPKVAQSVPEDKILIETDCPYLTPVPYRGKRNEPAYVKYVAEVIAKVRDISFEHAAKITTQNAFQAFGLSR